MKEKVRAAPKELIRRGLDDGTARLRGQFRETAQRGQASDYGGDRIEDTAARGAYQARRGVETLLKKKKSARDRLPDEEPRTPDSPTPPESPAELPLESPAEPPSKPQAERSPEFPSEPPSPHDPPTREQPRIKTREAVSARKGGAGPSESGRARLSPGEKMRQSGMKTRESAVHDPRPEVPPAPQAGSDPPQVRTREVAVHDIPANVEPAPRVRSEPPKIKTRDAATGAPADYRTAEPSPGNSPSANRRSIKTRDA